MPIFRQSRLGQSVGQINNPTLPFQFNSAGNSMEITSLEQNLIFMLINLGYAVISLFISVIALVLIDKYIFRNIDFIEEIKKGNLAVAIFQSVILIFIGFVVSAAMT
jgi:uncharacterized membrane protein YjfL (UPF0719 family)